jgi:hypothetical protein
MTVPLMLSVLPDTNHSASAWGIALVLRNCTARPVTVLFDDRLQPPVPQLRNAAGVPIEPADQRRIAKFDRTPYSDLFVALAPGASLDLRGSFHWVDQAWEGTFGPFRFAALAPGRYTLWATWTSALTRGVEPDSAAERPIPGVWTGQLRSEPVVLNLSQQ